MNSEEGTSLAKMAVTVLLVVLVIGAVVAVVYMAYSWFTSGTDKLGDQVNSLDSSAYSQFDDKQCTGTDVLTALKTYRDSDVAILIGNGVDSISDYETAVGNNGAGGASSLTVKNYCALAAALELTTSAETNGTYNATVCVDSGKYYLGADKDSAGINYDTTAGMAYRNTNFSPTQTKGKDCADAYVSQKANFYGKLVYDSEGEVCGIMFLRMK